MLSRKEQLALFKQNKTLKAAAAAGKTSSKTASKDAPAGSVRNKVHMSAIKSTIFQSNTRRSARNDRNVVMAGKKKIGSNTPIGKLQARLQANKAATSSSNTTISSSNKENTTKKCNKNLFGSDDDSEEGRGKSTVSLRSEIKSKLDEADYLHNKHGCHVARAYLEEIPKDDSCTHLNLLSNSLYWLTWIEIEKSDHQWERVEKLFLQADSLVRTSLDKKVITAAYEKFRAEADSLLEAKMESLNNS